jgi:hypothetical protein
MTFGFKEYVLQLDSFNLDYPVRSIFPWRHHCCKSKKQLALSHVIEKERGSPLAMANGNRPSWSDP